MTRKLAVVLFNLGGPDKPASVRPFLFNLFADKAIIRLPAPARLALAVLISTTRAKSARANYALMGGGSPLLPETQKQADALAPVLAKALPGVETRIFIAMRYWHPMTDETARAVADWAPDDIVLLPLYPQFSTTTTGSSAQAWQAAYRGSGKTYTVCCYPEAPGLATAQAQRIRAAWEAAGSPANVRLLFSAHGLPQQVVDAGDPYAMQMGKTCQAVLDALGPNGLGEGWDWELCYQSRVGRLKWLGPSTPEALAKAAQDGRGVVVVPIAFVSEHVETLVELDIEYAELAHELALDPYIRVPAVGTDPAFIGALGEIVAGALGRPGVQPLGTPCGRDWRECPCRVEAAS